MRGLALLLVVTPLAFPGAGALRAQHAADAPRAQAVRLDAEHGIAVDGVLDEAAWSRAPAFTGLRQREPEEGAAATEATEVRVLYDDEHLYIGVLARDREPESVIARILERDRLMEIGFDGRPAFTGDDAIAVWLDPFHDHRNAVVFGTNPNGAEFDALITDEGREFNVDWRGVWHVAAQRVPDGWSAEFAIPFRTLRYPGDGRTWGFNVYRIIRRKSEEVLWSGWSRANEGFTRVSRGGHLEGLTDLPRSGVNLEVKPYVLSGATQEAVDPNDLDTEGRLEVGGDVKYEVRPGLLLDLTANTDFAQVEVDDEQVNLTRFDLFFPEKRDFFLENAGVFEFGTRGFFEPPPFLLFFSRQIGIAEDGEVPVIGGARLTGRVGAQTIGLLDIVTDSAFDQPRTNFAVARVKRDFGSSNYVGAIATDRRSAHAWNTAGGIDASYWPVGTLNLQSFVARTATDAGDEDWAYRLGWDYQTDRLGVTGQHLYVGPEAVADMGFVTRTDIRRTGGFARVTARPPVVGIRRLDFFGAGEHILRSDGLLQDWNAGIGFNPQWNSGDQIVLFAWSGFTRLDEAFDLSDTIPVPIGDYDSWEVGWLANSSPNRPVVLETTASFQGNFGGRLSSVMGGVTVNPDPHLSLAVSYTRNRADLPGGAFTGDVGSLRVALAFSTRVFLNALVQYNSLDRTVSTNVRLNVIHRPGSDIFIVFNEERGSDTSLWDTDNRGAVVKVTYLARI